MKTAALGLLLLGMLCACTPPAKKTKSNLAELIDNPTNRVLLRSEVVWEKLNPARGAQSPQAGTLWGDRKGKVATGFLAKFVDGFSSPPHIHNVTYRAVVIKGTIHNDDPTAEPLWMPPGSFWTQPVGESHITAAKGKENLALVEIDQGPYLVRPTSEAFDDGERPINIDVSNLVWLDSHQCQWITATSSAKISFLLEQQDSRSLFVQLPQGFDGTLETQGSVMHAVLIQGEVEYQMPIDTTNKLLDPGSYFGSSTPSVHPLKTTSETESMLYIRTNGALKIN